MEQSLLRGFAYSTRAFLVLNNTADLHLPQLNRGAHFSIVTMTLVNADNAGK
jgi:hypothetical protein